MLFLIVLRLVWFIDCFYLKIYKPFFEIDRYRCGKCLGSMTILTEGEALRWMKRSLRYQMPFCFPFAIFKIFFITMFYLC